MRSWLIFLVASASLLGQDATVPALPGASLLVGTPPFYLMVTNQQGESIRLQPEYEQPDVRGGGHVYPSISMDGKVVAYARVRSVRPQTTVAISTYSVRDDKKAEYAEGEYFGSIAISPDGAKLAFSGSRYRENGPGDDHLHVIDLKTRQETVGPATAPLYTTIISWAPDSRRLAYSFNNSRVGEIRVWDLETGKVSKIADGGAPAWSPSGEWIAYFHGTGGIDAIAGEWEPRCLLVHPDGTGSKVALDLPEKKGARFFEAAPVWSPDSRTILINELDDRDTGTVEIHLLHLPTLKLQTIFKDTVRVWGWAQAK